MKRGFFGSRTFAIIILIISIVIILLNFYIYSYYLRFAMPLNAHASNSADLSLIVEASSITYPDVSIVYPENATYTSHRTGLNYTVSGSGLDVCKYSLNLGATNTTIICGENISGITSIEGSNIWKVYVSNTAGGTNSSSVTFFVSIPAPSVSPSGGGGGGGGAIAPISALKEFDVFPTELNIFAISGEQIEKEIKLANKSKINIIISGEQIEKEIKLANKGKINITINISLSGINEIAGLDTNQITLGKDEEKSIFLILKIPKEGISAGRIIFSSGDISKEVFILINARSEKKLFDVSLISPEIRKIIMPGEDLSTFISLTQVGPPGKVDVTVNYIIKDFDGNVLSSESESFSVYESKGFARDFKTIDLPPGDYIAGIEIIYPGGFATSSIHFVIAKRIARYWTYISIILGILAVVVVIYSIITYKKAGRHEYPKWKIKGQEK